MADSPSTENRVYLFRELAAAFVGSESALLTSADPKKRARARTAFAELARVASLVSGESAEEAETYYDLVANDVLESRAQAAKAEKAERKAAEKALKKAQKANKKASRKTAKVEDAEESLRRAQEIIASNPPSKSARKTAATGASKKTSKKSSSKKTTRKKR